MRVKRSIIIPAILALSAAGSVVAGSAASVATTSAPAVAVAAHAAHPDMLFHG